MRAGRLLQLMRLLLFAVFCPAADVLALDLTELNAHRAAWNSHDISDYDYILQRQCRCSGNVPGLVSVRSDGIVSVVDPETFAPLPAEQFLTIDELFDHLAQGLGTPGYIVAAEFDAVLSYPRLASLDDPQIADENVVYFASDLVVVPEPRGAAIALVLGVIGFSGTVRRKRVSRNS